VRRREFITVLGGAAAWPFRARGQQSGKIPKIGFLFPGTETVAPLRIAALAEGLRAVGYRVPDQVELIARVTGGDPSHVAPTAKTHRYVIEVPGMLSEDGWQKKYGGGL